jgi:hypothetical protein
MDEWSNNQMCTRKSKEEQRSSLAGFWEDSCADDYRRDTHL